MNEWMQQQEGAACSVKCGSGLIGGISGEGRMAKSKSKKRPVAGLKGEKVRPRKKTGGGK